jgi:uncharacterized protein (TIGR01777 family)
MARVLVSGVSGPIGAALLPSLEQGGGEVVRLVRGPVKGPKQISWNPLAPLAPDSVSGFDSVIHLAGESIVGRWTPEKKTKIRDSRVCGTQALANALARTSLKPRVLVCASAIGIYGDRGDQHLTEESASGRGFLADVGREWEAATRGAAAAGIRTVNIRIGVVLSTQGGALAKMLAPFKLGLGGRIGSGQQWWSWIHVDDIVGAIHHLGHVESVSGPVNLVAPAPVTNQEFTRVLANVLGRPAVFPVPAFAARLAFGEMADEVLLSSQRVVPTKLQSSGYDFQYRDLQKSLQDLVG